MSADDCVRCTLAQLDPDLEPLVRKSLDLIFSDLQYISPGEPEPVSSYLDSIQEPLSDLWELGFLIFAIVSSGIFKTPQGTIPTWSRAYYLIVPQGGYFRIGREPSETVHRFDANCQDGVNALVKAVKEQTLITVWPTTEPIKKALEGNVPWCENCCLEEMGA